MGIVWINMLPGDTEAAAKRSAETILDPRVRHFYDPEKRSGKAIAKSLGGEGKVAWDIYLFYKEGSQWVEDPPTPAKWMHQMKDSWADPGHARIGDALVEELHKAMKELTGLSA